MSKKCLFARRLLHGICAMLILAASTASAQTSFRIIHIFDGTDGSSPTSSLIMDAAGSLYGTTVTGGITHPACSLGNDVVGCGTVFRRSHTPTGWVLTELRRFEGGKGDGWEPFAGVVADQSRNLYGTTYEGGLYGSGTVFELSPTSTGGWEEKLLYSFQGSPVDCVGAVSGLVFDTAGNLYGTTEGGGSYDHGCLFELSPGANGGWNETVLYSFTGASDGWSPQSRLIFDAAGDLYGTTAAGGNFTACTNGCGVVFKLSATIYLPNQRKF
jgi:uncharacterized repeat protein (TIGR03803 family)